MSKHITHPEDQYHRLIGRCEQAWRMDIFFATCFPSINLRPEHSLPTLHDELEAWDAGDRDLNQVDAEASTRQEILRVSIESASLQMMFCVRRIVDSEAKTRVPEAGVESVPMWIPDDLR